MLKCDEPKPKLINKRENTKSWLSIFSPQSLLSSLNNNWITRATKRKAENDTKPKFITY